eukprot:COSAG01_NODE_12097_length_1801_cov_8.356639_3_plen_189_part_00
MAGRQAYSRAELEEIVQADRKAEKVQVQPVETVVRFDSDRSSAREPLYVRRRTDGQIEVVTSGLSALGVVDSEEEDEVADTAFSVTLEPTEESVSAAAAQDVAEPDGVTDAGALPDLAQVPAAAHSAAELGGRKRARSALAPTVAKKPRGRPPLGMEWNEALGRYVPAGADANSMLKYLSGAAKPTSA